MLLRADSGGRGGEGKNAVRVLVDFAHTQDLGRAGTGATFTVDDDEDAAKYRSGPWNEFLLACMEGRRH